MILEKIIVSLIVGGIVFFMVYLYKKTKEKKSSDFVRAAGNNKLSSKTINSTKKPGYWFEYLDGAGGTDELYEMLRSRPQADIEEICKTYPIEALRLDWNSIQKDFRNNKRFELITFLAQILVQYRGIVKESPERRLPDSLPSEQLTETLMSRLISFIRNQKDTEIAHGLRIRLYDFAISLMEAGRNSDALQCLLASKPSIKEDHDFWICACRHNIAMISHNFDDIADAVKAVEEIVNGKVKVPERYVEGARNMLNNLQKL